MPSQQTSHVEFGWIWFTGAITHDASFNRPWAVFGFKLKRQRWRCWQSPYDLCLKFNLIPWCFSFKVFSPGSSEGRKLPIGSFKKLAHFFKCGFSTYLWILWFYDPPPFKVFPWKFRFELFNERSFFRNFILPPHTLKTFWEKETSEVEANFCKVPFLTSSFDGQNTHIGESNEKCFNIKWPRFWVWLLKLLLLPQRHAVLAFVPAGLSCEDERKTYQWGVF